MSNFKPAQKDIEYQESTIIEIQECRQTKATIALHPVLKTKAKHQIYNVLQRPLKNISLNFVIIPVHKNY